MTTAAAKAKAKTLRQRAAEGVDFLRRKMGYGTPPQGGSGSTVPPNRLLGAGGIKGTERDRARAAMLREMTGDDRAYPEER